MAMGTPAQQNLARKYFNPFFNWNDDDKLREWLSQQEPDELEQFLNWFDFSRRRDRETLGRQELAKLRNPAAKLGSLLRDGRSLLDENEPVQAHSEFGRWVNAVARWLETEMLDPALSAIWSGLPHSRLVSGGSYSNDAGDWDHFKIAVSKRLSWLGEAVSSRGDAGNRRQSKSLTSLQQSSKKVFVVHGHAGIEQAVARFLRVMGFDPIILHEQANQGRTIIEKFERHGDEVGFAVVLLTPDDVGGAKDGPQQSRPRQNVILELGYFIGSLGRDKVCALKQGDMELPSDILGVMWEEFDRHGAWKLKLAKELREAGYEVDMNKIIV